MPTAAPAPSGCYSLSVRRSERAAWDAVTHYRIHRLDNGWLYIAPRLTFPSLHDLVDHYSGNAPTAPPANPAWGDPLRPAGMGGKCGGWSHTRPGAPGVGVQVGAPTDAAAPCPEFGEGLCCSLGEPCSTQGPRVAPVPAMPAVVKKPSLNWDQIDRWGRAGKGLGLRSPPVPGTRGSGLPTHPRLPSHSSLLFSGAASPPDEDSPISLGLREAISSYLLLTETDTPKQGPGGALAKSS